MELINLKTLEIIDVDQPNNYSDFKNMILTIGIFDGVHFAHETIIKKMNEVKAKKGFKSALMTFDPHPDYVLGKRRDNGYITPIKIRIEIFKNLDVDYLIIFNFTKQIASLSYEEFYNKYLSNFASFVVGYDFTFGAFASGKAEYLKKMKSDTIIVNEIDYDNEKISSSKIRDYLLNGEVNKIPNMLGCYYSVSGVVATGAHLGTKLGFPTANIEFNSSYFDILNGVYFVRIKYEGNYYKGIANVGHNPSINYVENKRLEVHLFDFNLNIYGKIITVEFIEFLRNEQKFNSKEELIEQIKKDISKVKDLEIN